MNFLVVGLGSMGKRRIRCLQYLGYENIVGFDLREDRRLEAKTKYSISVVDDFEKGLKIFNIEAMIISVPPDLHDIYIQKAIFYKINFFVEASVIDENMTSVIKELKKSSFIGCPSTTLNFHPAIKHIKKLITDNVIGKISNFHYHSGQYLPDWHKYEDVSDFYVSNPDTGGAREIVPFELTWLIEVFGLPIKVFGNNKKTIEIEGAEHIDDTYNVLMEFSSHLGSLIVDVVSRSAVRKLIVNGSEGQIIWDWNKDIVEFYTANKDKWENITYNAGKVEAGYNKNIGEIMYIDELNAFIKNIKREAIFPNNFEKDQKILNMLYAIELSNKTGKVQSV